MFTELSQAEQMAGTKVGKFLNELHARCLLPIEYPLNNILTAYNVFVTTIELENVRHKFYLIRRKSHIILFEVNCTETYRDNTVFVNRGAGFSIYQDFYAGYSINCVH